MSRSKLHLRNLRADAKARRVAGVVVVLGAALCIYLAVRIAPEHLYVPARASLPPAVTHLAVRPRPAAGRPLPAIAIVIDDMGNNLRRDRQAIALPAAVTLSFLPYPAGTPDLAREAAGRGHEILVHVPMQPKDGEEDPGPMALRAGLSPPDIENRLVWALTRVPGFDGINNHMGSLFTEDRAGLAAVDEVLRARNLFFFDSRTTAGSLVVETARAAGVPSAARDVFLDDVQTDAAVRQQLSLLEQNALEHGVAIAIGHPHAVTLAVLARWCARPDGLRLVPVRDAIRLKMEKGIAASVAAKAP